MVSAPSVCFSLPHYLSIQWLWIAFDASPSRHIFFNFVLGDSNRELLPTSLKDRIRKGETTFGSWILTGSPIVVDVLSNLGFDWLVFDMEHSPISLDTTAGMIQVLNRSEIAPLVRIAQIDQAGPKHVLDAGAKGVVAPLVNTAEDAERVVAFCKYPPAGVRGVAGAKASRYGLDLGNYIRRANEETIVVVQIETPQSLKNVGEIVAVKGVDVAFVGPMDLTMNLGLFDNRSNAKVLEAMKEVVKACGDAGKTAGVFAANVKEAELAVERGFKFVSLASDVDHLIGGARSFLSALKKTYDNSTRS